MSSTYGIGIDFGATTCVVAMSKAGQTDVIPNEMGNRSTSVCVAYTEDGTITVGDAAYNQKERNLPGTIRGFKKFLGQEFEDEVTKEDIADAATLKNLEIVQSASSSTCALKLSWQPDSPIPLEEIATLVFGKIKETASLYLGENVSHCCLTVPGHFSASKAAIIQECCEGSGMRVMRLLKEPCAALIAQGSDVSALFLRKFHHVLPNTENAGDGGKATGFCNKSALDESVRNVAVVDLGGSSFDVSVVAVSQGSGLFTPLVSSGSGSLGSTSCDELLFDYCVKDLRRKDAKAAMALKKDARASLRLKEACEKGKKALTMSKIANIEVEALLGDVDFFTKITREQFEDLLQKGTEGGAQPVSDMLEILEEVVEKMENNEQPIDGFLLIGGGCNTPLVQKTVSGFFAEKCPDAKELKFDGVMADEAVAVGAAIQADLLLNLGESENGALEVPCALKPCEEGEDEDEEPAGIAMEATTLTQAVGIKMKQKDGSAFYPVLRKGVPIPVSHKESFACHPGKFGMEICLADGSLIATVPIETTHHHLDLELSVDANGTVSAIVDNLKQF
ncbi:unnamed protein product [Amoebophrya sp. A25]|nr:unnamed protein product [Amoebophrya sp. A25]|eukprot:GSA25T00003837001.1